MKRGVAVTSIDTIEKLYIKKLKVLFHRTSSNADYDDNIPCHVFLTHFVLLYRFFACIDQGEFNFSEF